LPLSLRIRGHFPAPIINGEEIDFENGPKQPNLRLSWAPDLDFDLGSGHGHYLFSSLIEYYLYAKFHRYRRNFLWTDGHTDGKLPPIVLGRLPKFGSRPKNVLMPILYYDVLSFLKITFFSTLKTFVWLSIAASHAISSPAICAIFFCLAFSTTPPLHF